MSDNFEDFDGIGPASNDRLHENGYETYEDIADADPDDLSELKGITEDRALRAIAQAEDELSDEDGEESEAESDEDEELESPMDIETSESDSEGSDEEEVEEDSDEDETAQDDESDSSAEDELEEPYELELDLDGRSGEVFTTALMDSFVQLKDRNRSRAMACDRVLEKYRDSNTAELHQDELNATYSALREKKTEYKGDNHIDLMRVASDLEDDVNELRKDVMY